MKYKKEWSEMRKYKNRTKFSIQITWYKFVNIKSPFAKWSGKNTGFFVRKYIYIPCESTHTCQ